MAATAHTLPAPASQPELDDLILKVSSHYRGLQGLIESASEQAGASARNTDLEAVVVMSWTVRTLIDQMIAVLDHRDGIAA
ncbi:hypothetical protein [Acidiphilium sp.]|uniref:hypothetical protein n=1 Tax=Acidiphilium sp. TaxID=527 RepID=UPI002586B4A4|nr:hypothetical protein [Acidiphilium sp.]